MEGKDFFARDRRTPAELIAQLSDAEVMTRWAAVVALGSSGDPIALPALKSSLTDADDLVRQAARSSLDRLVASLGDEAEDFIDATVSDRVIQQSLAALKHFRTQADAPAYKPWKVRALPKPSDADPLLLEAAIMDIVATEGPVLGRRLTGLYGQACSRDNPRSFPRTRLVNAVRHLTDEGELVCVDGIATDKVEEWTLRTPHQPDVYVRQRGTRELGEIPVTEIRTVWRATQRRALHSDSEQAMKFVLDFYGVRPADFHIVGSLLEREWLALLREM